MKKKANPPPPEPTDNQPRKFQYLTFEDEIKLDEQFPERERGGIGTLVRAILDKNERYDVEITIHKSFMANSYYINPSALAQQSGTSHAYIKAWRDGDVVHIKASQTEFASARSWTGQLAERLQRLPEVNSTGGIPYLDIPWCDVPSTYQYLVSLIPRRTNPRLQHCKCEVKAYKNFLRVWLHRDTPRSKSPSRRLSKAIHD